MEKKKSPDPDVPGTSGWNARKKVNVWQQIDQFGEMDAPSVHHLRHENLHLEGVVAYDQRKLEQGMMDQMDQAFNQQRKTLEAKRAEREIKRVEAEVREVKLRIKQAERTLEIASSDSNNKDTRKRLESVRCQKTNKENQLKMLQAKVKRLQKVAGISPADASLEDVAEEDIEQVASSSVSWALTGKGDEERERLIKLGLMTPFGSMIQDEESKKPSEPKKRKLFLDDGFSDFLTSQKQTKISSPKVTSKKIVPKKLKVNKFKIPKKKNSSGLKAWIEEKSNEDVTVIESKASPCNGLDEQSLKSMSAPTSDDEYVPDEADMEIEQHDKEDEEEMQDIKPKKKPKCDPETGSPIFDYEDEPKDNSSKRKLKSSHKVMDDGKLTNYKKRMKKYHEDMKRELAEGKDYPEDKNLGNDYKVPGKIWSRLYKYQRTGVRWLCELHSQKVGGILGDEMGLGKTVQIIAFLATVRQSNLRSRSVPGYAYEGLGPVLIITPTTVMHQWVKEFHTWWPEMRVAILHDSGTYESSRAQLVDNIAESHGVLITSYERARINVDMLLEQGWHYVILDEGHKIRNPEAAVTVALKLFRTPHRLILSGSPVQNNLKELWSLFDFIFPGKLGTLAVFMEQFSVPIVQGGYSNATEIQVHTAYKCACKLRDTISPYLLRRMKRDVQLSLDLPSKNEQVLFCWLSEDQIEVYKKYLDSDQVHSILTREMKVFAGLIQLRKICNHPDLYTGGPKIMVGEPTPSPRDKRSFGYYKRSGKMLVIASLLKSWKKQGHKVLLFTQSKAMLDILEIYLSSREYKYLTMHGGTPVQTRQPLISQFNKDPSLFVFLLTTRVGGLGVNLTGANRVVIFDPDWNPSTDSQAQERAWRIGQRRDVTIYRLLTLGTIEEKIYHRQIFKQFLTNRVLKDPWQRRFFKSNDLHELFILKDYGTGKTSRSQDASKSETASIFAGTGSEVKPESVKKRLSDKKEIITKLSDSARPEKCLPNGLDSLRDPGKCQSTIKIAEENSIIPSDEIDVSKDNPDVIQSTSQVMLSMADNEISITSMVEKQKSGNDLSCHAEQSQNICDNDSIIKTSSLQESLRRAKEKFEKQKLVEQSISHKKSKKKRKPVVDGETVKNLASVKDYKPNGGASEEIEEKSRKATDDYVLHKLFKRAGVHSALQHNTIMESSHPDYALVEVEAERVAKESVRNLRLSRRQYKYPTGRQPGSSSKASFGNNTLKKNIDKDDSAILKAENSVDHLFKGDHLKEKPNAEKSDSEEDSNQSDSPVPLSASQLLSMMRRRNHEEIHKQEEEDSAQQDEERDMFGLLVSQPDNTVSVTLNPTEHDEMMEDLRNFIAFGCSIDGRARTSEIMSMFGDKIKPSHAAIFKSILKELCTSEKSVDLDENVWYLKPEFR